MIVGRKGEPTLIRFPKGMLNDLRAVALVNGRSRNSEILMRLEASLKADQKLVKEATKAMAAVRDKAAEAEAA